MPSHIGPVLGRSSYIDDIAHGAKTWNQLCEDLDTLLYRLRYWNISVNLSKSEFGKRSIPYLSHEISAEGIRSTPKVAKGVMDLPLNYYHKFIEDFPVVVAVLYDGSGSSSL
ncbi:reverse transcriptase [Phytophthora megakarya]|uniref:Reverse transcriptase n=1 Tax=Phytophthora megakarya TaxID=4795 RepID=A0A225VU75_9STRA|nr:reverse transcriptase [Phytophthora megakarya]